MTDFGIDQRVFSEHYYPSRGIVREQLRNGKLRVAFYDDTPRLSRGEEPSVFDVDPKELEPWKPIEIDRVAMKIEPGQDVPYSYLGYVITEDGTVYALTKKWTHGVVCALLFPELAEKHGYWLPDEEYNVYYYQAFELDHQREIPVVRIALGMMTPLNISKSNKAATPAQIEGVRRCMKAMGKNLNDKCHTSLMETTVRKMYQWLADSEED